MRLNTTSLPNPVVDYFTTNLLSGVLDDVKTPQNRELVERTRERAEHMFNCAAARIEWLTALIVCAENPVAMLQILRPVLVDPDNGQVAQVYTRIAARELQRRIAAIDARQARKQTSWQSRQRAN